MILAPNVREAAEQAVLGSVLLTENALDIIVSERLRPDHFRRVQHEALLRAMLALKDAGQSVDALTLKARFNSPQSPVCAADIELLAASAGNLSSLRDYCRIVREGAWFDDAADALTLAGEALRDQDRSALLEAVARLDESDTAEEQTDIGLEFQQWYDSDKKDGWPLPFGALMEATGGLAPGEPTVLGGWSGMGKSFLLAQMLRHCAKAGARVHEYANEMHGPKRTMRTLTSLTGIPMRVIERKGLTDKQLVLVQKTAAQLPYQTTPTAGWPVEDYCRSIRRQKWDVCAIDTVTNLPCSRVDEWDRACVMLADAAAQANTHLILVCQLNLERDKGRKPPPVGRDLRNTGAWYQRARVVMFVHRDQEQKNAGDGAVIYREIADGHIRVEKATHGDPTKGFVPVTFNPRWLRFDELDGYRHALSEAA